jgi:hypothetical protein
VGSAGALTAEEAAFIAAETSLFALMMQRLKMALGGEPLIPDMDVCPLAEHTKNKTKSNKEKHENGQSRLNQKNTDKKRKKSNFKNNPNKKNKKG